MSDSSSTSDDELTDYPRILELGVETELPPEKKWIPPKRILHNAYVKACEGVPLDKIGQLKELVAAVLLTDANWLSKRDGLNVVSKIMSYSDETSSSSEDEYTSSSSEDDWPPSELTPVNYDSYPPMHSHDEDDSETSTSESTEESDTSTETSTSSTSEDTSTSTSED